jgi:hypothetical protein
MKSPKRSKTEQETIYNFNEEEQTCYLYTCNKTLIRHMEKKLGLVPTIIHGRYVKEYEFPKSWLPKPRKPKKMSEEARKKAGTRLAAARKARTIRQNGTSAEKPTVHTRILRTKPKRQGKVLVV